MGKADLHTHTSASDGSLSPAALVKLASAKSLNTLSITDHDTIKGYLKAKKSAEEHNVRLLPGVELTAIWDKREVHILGYCFSPSNQGLRDLLSYQKQARLNRMVQIVDYLKKKGVDINLDEVEAEARGGTIGRPHVANVLIKKKVVASVAEAFIRYLGQPILEQIEVNYESIENVIEIVKSAGGALILAHPGGLYSEEEIQILLDFGLDGLECIHPSHNFNLQKTCTERAERDGLLVTGGSDFHGSDRKYNPYFGVVTLSEKRVDKLVRMTDQRKKLLDKTGGDEGN